VQSLALILLLGASPLECFEAHINRAAHEGGVGRVEVRVGLSRKYEAWVYPPHPVVWIDRDFLGWAPPDELCRTAYHEVCHLWLKQHGQRDDDDHRDVKACMRRLGAWRCIVLEKVYP